jgi:hypothetical protein
MKTLDHLLHGKIGDGAGITILGERAEWIRKQI